MRPARALVSAASLALCAACGSGSGSAPMDAGVDASSLMHVDRAHLADVGLSGALDYGDPALWLCRPDIDANECGADLDATEILPDGSRKVAVHVPAPEPAFDCFYVYPTVSFSGGNVTDFSSVAAQLDPLLSQAARFDRLCAVYAPLYRQVSISLSGGLSGDLAIAQQDVRDAFRYYLAHLNRGRRFVILGHSQGTLLLIPVLQSEVEGHPDVLGRMISALLIGGNVRVADPPDAGLPLCAALGQTACVSFRSLPLCTAPGMTGCVIAYSSYRAESPPDPATALFGRGDAVSKVACVDPAVVSGHASPYRGSYLPAHFENPLFAPTNAPLPDGVTTPFVLERDRFDGGCVDRTLGGVAFRYLEISLHQAAGDTRPEPPYYSTAQEALGFGLHVADYNLALDDLIDAVAAQAAAMP